jgi:hypothetical protein
MMAHIVLLGDSIFDNKAYTAGEPDVITHLRGMMSPEWKATLQAIDGSVIKNVSKQMSDCSPDATHFVISVGGNDAILNADVLQMVVNSSAEVFNELANRVGTFEHHYREMLKTVLSKNLPTVVCTIYFPNIPENFAQKISAAALASFNDVIIRQAVLHSVPVLDLRLICNEKTDYANEIEPSGQGGRKIAAKILEAVQTHNFAAKQTSIYV